MQPKPATESITTMTEIVLPTHANALGSVFGGQILAWMDVCAAICAQRHTGQVVVTAGVDELSFEGPIRVGQVVRLHASVTATFKSSLEVKVVVEGEEPRTSKVWPCVNAFMTFVAIDELGKPAAVTPLLLQGDRERELHKDAEDRRTQRLTRRRR